MSSENYNHGATRQWRQFDDRLIRFHTIPACDGQTDRQKSSLYQYRAQYYWRTLKTQTRRASVSVVVTEHEYPMKINRYLAIQTLSINGRKQHIASVFKRVKTSDNFSSRTQWDVDRHERDKTTRTMWWSEAQRAGRTCLVIERRSLRDEIAASREIPRHTSSYLTTAAARPNEARRQQNIWAWLDLDQTRPQQEREQRQLLIYRRLPRHRESDQRRPQSAVRATLEDHRERKRRQSASSSSQVHRGRNGSPFPFSRDGCEHFRSFEDEIKTTADAFLRDYRAYR